MVSEGKRWEVRVKRWMFGGLRVIYQVYAVVWKKQ